ncbi:family 43 glycosylhydrolase [Litorihabitans aurantiacus]|uniref:Beta-xylosidase C-terminal Concanavalin A-like domain-containing protein n=1 Tax=Litorihabitans aurantiacus TaxID=1930061 RepID=A0AA37XFH0_9MICO|nr:family 43 glycosylhydrolase [Litorihabitans aurantiacus]GMA32473.1 hypothetical protein GCM10025875_24650 [Litorihabitans aurantiacus]
MRELDLDRLALVGPEHVLWHGALGGAWIEAPHVYRRDGRYLLLCAEGGTGRDHAVTAATADVVTGPYTTDTRSPLLTHRHLGEDAAVQCVGHADLVETPAGEPWALVLGVRPLAGHHVLGRETFLVPARWDERGLVLAPGVGQVTGLAGTGADAGPGPVDWISLRGPVAGRVEPGGGPGDRAPDDVVAITLTPSPAPLRERGVPAFLGRRQETHRVSFTGRLETADVARQAVGLVALQDEATHAVVRVRREHDGGGCVAEAVQVLDGVARVLARVPLPEGQVELGVRSDGLRYELLASAAGPGTSPVAPVALLAVVPHHELSAEAGDTFVGVVLGVVVEGPADDPPVTVTHVRLRPGDARDDDTAPSIPTSRADPLQTNTPTQTQTRTS